MVLVRTEDLSKRFGSEWVLRRVSIELEAGDAKLVQGRSGAGKTTLLNLLAGLDEPTEGTIEVDGRDLGGMSEPKRARLRKERIGFVFQDFNLIPDLTVYENVLLPMELTGREDRSERAAQLVARFGLEGRAGAYPEVLSGGERQRVGIARALGNEPSLVLADEPTANLDEANARRVLRSLADVAGPQRAVLVASHDPLTPMYLGTGYRLEDGELTDDLLEPPAGVVEPYEDGEGSPA